MAEKSRMIFGNVLRGKFGRDLVGEWRPPAWYVAAAGGGCSMRAVLVVLVLVVAMLGVTEKYQRSLT